MNINFETKGKIGQRVYKKLSDLDITCYASKEPLSFDQRKSVDAKKLKIGDEWGQLFDCAWFELCGVVPEFEENKKLVLQIDIGGEGLVFDASLNVLTGITNKNSSYGIPPDKPGKWIIELEGYQAGEEVVFYIDASCNDLMGYVQNGGRIENASFATLDVLLRDLYYDLEVLMDWYMGNISLSSNQPSVMGSHEIKISEEVKLELERILFKASSILSEINVENIKLARKCLEELDNLPLVYKDLQIFAIGHAHLDIAWLWPIREGRRKAARTFATAIKNMDIHPNYIFGGSQQQLFEFIKLDHPGLFEKIKKKVQMGQFEVLGAFWVESDLNIPSGESLIRQIHYAREFNLNEFGIVVNYLWEPDVFGFTASIPQILSKSSLKYMCSQKLSQNKTNKFPHHSFKWIGNDGSSVLVHNFPENTYDSRARALSLVRLANNYIEKEIAPVALMVYGVGDGGGGPGEEHIERLERIKNKRYLPSVNFSRVDTFLEAFSKFAHMLPEVHGELYFERHQGTYTTEVLNKKGNRDMEYLLKEYEYLVTLNQVYSMESPEYEIIDSLWKEILLYQFHDIIPGSSIVAVYKETRDRYQYLYSKLSSLIEAAYNKFLDHSNMMSGTVIFNNTSIYRNEFVKINGVWQHIEMLPFSVKLLEKSSTLVKGHVVSAPYEVENDHIKVKFTTEGTLRSLIDKSHDKELIDLERVTPEIAIYTERATEYPAWDFADDYRIGTKHHPDFVSAEVLDEGHLYQLKAHYRYKSSTMYLEYKIWDNTSRVDVSAYFDWHEPDCTVKINYPITIEVREALCNIQYGNIYRPTHSETSVDAAKDEISAHKFVDVSDELCGIALLSTSKYGFRVKDKSLEMTVLRSQKKNGQEIGQECQESYLEHHFGDLTVHHFDYALFPHGVVNKEVVLFEEAIKVNEPLKIVSHSNEGHLSEKTFINISNTNIAVVYVKPSYQSKGQVVRILNPTDTEQRFVIYDVFGSKKLFECDLNEEHLEERSFNKEIKIGRYELMTFLFPL